MHEPEFAYGILIIVNSVFLLFFLITGLLYQRITDIVAFLICSTLLTIYVIQHYFTAKDDPDNRRITQPEIRLARLILTIVFNTCFIPLAYLVIKLYNKDEFSKRLFGAFPAARRPLKIYSVFDCCARVNTMLSISSLVLNLYNSTTSDVSDKVLLGIGVPLALVWLLFGIGMARLESYVLVAVFYVLSLFQIGALTFILYSGIDNAYNARTSTTMVTPVTTSGWNTTTIFAQNTTAPFQTTSTTHPPIPNMLPVIGVLYVCVIANILSHFTSLIMGFWCTRNFKHDLKERVFNTRIDKWVQQRWSG